MKFVYISDFPHQRPFLNRNNTADTDGAAKENSDAGAGPNDVREASRTTTTDAFIETPTFTTTTERSEIQRNANSAQGSRGNLGRPGESGQDLGREAQGAGEGGAGGENEEGGGDGGDNSENSVTGATQSSDRTVQRRSEYSVQCLGEWKALLPQNIQRIRDWLVLVRTNRRALLNVPTTKFG